MDLLEFIGYKDYGASTAYGNTIDWLMNEYRKIISGFKDFLPGKALTVGEPHIMWLQVTKHDNYHDNEARTKFNHCMKIVAKLQENTAVYFLQQLWESKNNNLVMKHNAMLTFEGLATMWAAIDRTIKYGVTKYQAKLDKAKIAIHLQNKNFNRNTCKNRGDNRYQRRTDRQDEDNRR